MLNSSTGYIAFPHCSCFIDKKPGRYHLDGHAEVRLAVPDKNNQGGTYMKTGLRSVLFALIVGIGILSVIASNKNVPVTPGKSTVIGARTGTVVDGYGASTRPASCLPAAAPPFPDAVDAWWNGFTPSVGIEAPVTGYRVWGNVPPPANCPTIFRTEVYRGFYEFDVTRFLGRSGAIMKAYLTITIRGTSVSPTSIAEPPLLPVTAYLCDNATAGAFQLRRVPPATVFSNGFDVNNGVGGTNTPALIPNGFSAGTNIFNFPNKTPSDPGSGSTARQFQVDISHDVVATLQAFEALNTNPPAPAGFAKMTFMMTGTNEPPQLKDAPLPFSDCRGAYSLNLEIQEP
jgi:hypothetical protein